ncbi:hypothetical protein PGTUg99_028375 [Puccinia graminis f. sp. tritici]|uniref:Uncharacterized protein n=1 Tax=Puccinia graminis f. sp. tritici TaxID=56615 RepID=A0A5B0SFZ4_PUCGR|nr:hypothetical protein PGTUg99_028375 [Puccinia graminis f. sp. tritici]
MNDGGGRTRQPEDAAFIRRGLRLDLPVVSTNKNGALAEKHIHMLRWMGRLTAVAFQHFHCLKLFVRVRFPADFPFGQVRILIGALLGAALGTHAHRDGQSRSC